MLPSLQYAPVRRHAFTGVHGVHALWGKGVACPEMGTYLQHACVARPYHKLVLSHSFPPTQRARTCAQESSNVTSCCLLLLGLCNQVGPSTPWVWRMIPRPWLS
jgi:hypothetical protein